MFRRATEKPKPTAKPVSKDESVRKESQIEDDLQSIGSAGNEDANIRFFEMLLQKGNNDSGKRSRGPIEKKKNCSSTSCSITRSVTIQRNNP